MRQIKLIAGQANVLLTKLPTGYADGVQKPKRVVKLKPFNPVYVLRKTQAKAA